MVADFANPFAGYGTIITGERFIGRKNSILAIENKIIRPGEASNLAIVGEPRIGKSSLAYQAIMEQKSELLKKRHLPIWVNLAIYETPLTFFRALVQLCRDELEDLDWLTVSLKNHTLIDPEKQNWHDLYSGIERFFKKVRLAGIQVIFIIDEFDHARHLFKGNITSFQGLRELSYSPKTRVAYVTTSRRSIREIEEQTQAISTLDGIFEKLYVGMFDRPDLAEYLTRLQATGLEVTPKLEEQLLYFTGNHPFLLDMLGYQLVEHFRETQEQDINHVADHVGQSFIDYYNQILRLLREDGKLDQLLQIVQGPVIDASYEDANIFKQYGLIKSSEKKTYEAFSEHFQSFLQLIEREVELQSIWRETEKALRLLIATTFEKAYGDDWFDKVEKAHPKLSIDRTSGKNLFQRCRDAQRREEQVWKERASHNLLDFTYSRELFDIVFVEWNTASGFKSIFGKEKLYWEQRAMLLSKVRNPLAHNRDEAISKSERRIAEGYCQEILEIIQKAEQASIS